MQHINDVVASWIGGNKIVARYIILFVEITTVAAVAHVFFRNWKIQPKGWKLKRTGIELLVAVISLPIGTFLLGGLGKLLAMIPPSIHAQLNPAPAPWWVIALEYVSYVLIFDTWFYWWHRLMHIEPMYKIIHKVHHWSTSPSPITTVSVSPFESLINGGIVPLMVTFIPFHADTMKFITPTAIIMGIYVHSGYEFLPRWWNKTWLTKWFISATFHDQHHKYFNYNFGGYLTIWDYLCGTVRKKYEEDFAKIGTKKSDDPVSPEVVPAE